MPAELENKSYILTQGPLPETIGHFWTMVWQQHVSAIVMLCKFIETGICKCAPYWPETTEEDDLIHVPGPGLEVRLRDFDDEKEFLVRSSYTCVNSQKKSSLLFANTIASKPALLCFQSHVCIRVACFSSNRFLNEILKVDELTFDPILT